eukprot:6316026-Prymnesium_polylepis.1
MSQPLLTYLISPGVQTRDVSRAWCEREMMWHVRELEPWRLERVWPRLAASGRRLAGVWTSG